MITRTITPAVALSHGEPFPALFENGLQTPVAWPQGLQHLCAWNRVTQEGCCEVAAREFAKKKSRR